ncbi:MAG: hypothetical protein IT210_05425 [Armatimonadetes bacterium]|nr:hypothetical protein [Armatimonadota bacterium]
MKRVRWNGKALMVAGVFWLFIQAGAWADVGVRALGMGGAFVSVADDASAVYWNPAGLVQLKGQELSYTYNTRQSSRANRNDLEFRDFVNKDIMLDHFLAYARPVGDKAAFGIQWISDKTDYLTRQNFKEYTTQDTVGLSYATKLDEQTSLGLNLRFVNMHQVNYQQAPLSFGRSADGIGFDLGLLRRLSEQWQVGLLLQDMNRTTLTDVYLQQTYFSHLNIRPGVSYRPNDQVTFALDIYNLNSEGVGKSGQKLKAKVAFGIEGKLPLMQNEERPLTGRIGAYLDAVTVGLGYRHQRTRFDFAFIGGKYDTAQVGLTFEF